MDDDDDAEVAGREAKDEVPMVFVDIDADCAIGKEKVSGALGGGTGGGTDGEWKIGESKKSEIESDDDNTEEEASVAFTVWPWSWALLEKGIDGNGCSCLSEVVAGLSGCAGVSNIENRSSSNLGIATPVREVKRPLTACEARGGGARGAGKVVGSGEDPIMLDKARN